MMTDDQNTPDQSAAAPQGDAADAQPTELGENSVCISDNSLQGAKDGDQVEFTGTGTYKESNGKRYVQIEQVDGDPINSTSEEVPQGDAAVQDAKANLMNNISKQGGYNNSME